MFSCLNTSTRVNVLQRPLKTEIENGFSLMTFFICVTVKLYENNVYCTSDGCDNSYRCRTGMRHFHRKPQTAAKTRLNSRYQIPPCENSTSNDTGCLVECYCPRKCTQVNAFKFTKIYHIKRLQPGSVVFWLLK
jgi:hypothetical protein